MWTSDLNLEGNKTCVTHDMKKIQQGYARVIVELMVLFAIIYAGIQNVFGKEPYS